MNTVLVIIVGWIVLSVPVSLLIGRFLAGNRRAAEAAERRVERYQPEIPAMTVLENSETSFENAFGELLPLSER